ncbi:hypothetical protein MLD38_030585 [Melastoma candidum]|uniref:Uncharacterized protein n=1 Tax=Melastoma candidum TaxID=119954 RepID=A0ACB9MLV1_9MYRT|nr:hypothetical protein MLD38_030585 [Melastoma candidum]
MDAEAARRRVATMASHFAAVPDDLHLSHRLIPLNCSASLNSVAVPRGDNRMCFARQGSASQARFMRQAPSSSVHQGSKDSSNAPAVPKFSRPCMAEQRISPSARPIRPATGRCDLTTLDPSPKFARPIDRVSREGQADLRTKMLRPRVVQGAGWSPKMDVAESGSNYVLTVEIPGVRSKDIRVEVSDQILRVLGIRSAQATYRVSGYPDDSILSFHKTEITRGPYEVVWPLPANANRDRVSAEAADGFLQIIVPKL